MKRIHPAFSVEDGFNGDKEDALSVSVKVELNSVEKTGGSENHILTLSEIPAHGGHIPDMEANWGQCDESTYYLNIDSATGSGVARGCGCRPFVRRDGNELVPRSFQEGSGGSHNNLQPYITCYMWKRVE